MKICRAMACVTMAAIFLRSTPCISVASTCVNLTPSMNSMTRTRLVHRSGNILGMCTAGSWRKLCATFCVLRISYR